MLLGGIILYWMYRDFDFGSIRNVLLHQMDWGWMLLSLPFGFLAPAFRGLRWRQALEPMGERTRRSVSVNAVLLSYASSLVVPRIGEFARCGVLRRWDGVAFAKALGTVVTERAIDTLLVLTITLVTLLGYMRVFDVFFHKTGTRYEELVGRFSTTGWLVTFVCGIAVLLLLGWLFSRLRVYQHVRATLTGLWQGVLSVRQVSNKPLFIFYTLAIWVCYFLHYYLTFFCFDATANLGMSCALVTFVVGSVAVIVPTPNGAGPWHFAVKTMLLLYGVQQTDALYFVLIVHTVQTLFVALMGIYAWLRLNYTPKY